MQPGPRGGPPGEGRGPAAGAGRPRSTGVCACRSVGSGHPPRRPCCWGLARHVRRREHVVLGRGWPLMRGRPRRALLLWGACAALLRAGWLIVRGSVAAQEKHSRSAVGLGIGRACVGLPQAVWDGRPAAQGVGLTPPLARDRRPRAVCPRHSAAKSRAASNQIEWMEPHQAPWPTSAKSQDELFECWLCFFLSPAGPRAWRAARARGARGNTESPQVHPEGGFATWRGALKTAGGLGQRTDWGKATAGE
jgi:hypothetical protein